MTGRDDALGAVEWQQEGQDAGLGDELTAVEQGESATAHGSDGDDGADSGLTPAEAAGPGPGM